MIPSRRPFLLMLMLAAVLLRTTLGAPCCMAPLAAQEQTHASGAEHMMHEGHVEPSGHHDGAEGDITSNPCCSACGPTLPSEPTSLAVNSVPRQLAEPTPIRALETRPPFPAYEATGPPEQV